MSSSSSTSTSLPRPKSSPSLHIHTHTHTQQNKMKREAFNFTPLSTPSTSTSSQPPIMVALAGWPEPIYVSSIPSSLSSMFDDTRRGSTGCSTMGFEPLSSGQVYDGVPISMSTTNMNGNPHKKIKSRPTTPPGLPSTSTSVKSETSTSSGVTGMNKSENTNSNSNQTSTSSTPTATSTSIREKVLLRTKARTKSNPIPNVLPKPISAPNLSIFAPVCQYLTDPSLGPCPFKSHPHDVRNMFPPTSHLSTSPPLDSTSISQLQMQNTISPSLTQELSSPTSEYTSNSLSPLSSPELEKSLSTSPPGIGGERKNPNGLTNYFPIPGAGAPKPRAVARLNPKATSSTPKIIDNNSNGSTNGKRKGTTFNDPRYGPTAGIIHKGRALPVVPSWDTPPVNNGFAITSNSNETGKGKGKQIQDEDDPVDQDEKMDIDEEEIINSSSLICHTPNDTVVKVEV